MLYISPAVSPRGHQQKKRFTPGRPLDPCASGGPDAQNVNWRPGCVVFYWVLVDRGPCRPKAPDATKDSDSTGRRKVVQTQNGSPDATRYDCRIVEVLRCN